MRFERLSGPRPMRMKWSAAKRSWSSTWRGRRRRERSKHMSTWCAIKTLSLPDGSSREDSLQFPRSHEAARKRQAPDDHLQTNRRHLHAVEPNGYMADVFGNSD